MSQTLSGHDRPKRSVPKSSYFRARKNGAKWSVSKIPSQRIGTGIRYGKLDLSPRDSYSLKKKTEGNHKLRIAILGGNEEVGRNMTMLEYGEDIILVDMGIQFGEEHMRGIDGIVPDLSSLKGREHHVRAVIITHMHMDHIGAIPYLMPNLPGVPVFGSPITLAMIAKKLEYTPKVKVDLRPVDDRTTLNLGNFDVSFIGVSHSVPSALAVVINTPCGKVVHTGDFKIDLDPKTAEEQKTYSSLKALGKENVLALLSDSTNASLTGNQLMERDVIHDLEEIIESASGRLFFGMISTNVVRLAQIIRLAETHGRKVALGGLSIRTTFEIATQLGYIKVKPSTIIEVNEIKDHSPKNVLAVFPGAQGESNAAFFRLASNSLKGVHVVDGDTVVFSSSVIPGNERSVQFITDKFYRLGAKVVNYRMLNIHAGGHAKAADLGEVVRLVQPKYLVPIEGHHAFLHHHAKAATDIGFPKDRIFVADNGQWMEFDKKGKGVLTKDRMPIRMVFVDAKSIDGVDEDTLSERKRIGDDGVLVVRRFNDERGAKQVHVTFCGFIKKAHQHAWQVRIENLLKSEGDNHGHVENLLAKMIETETGLRPFISLYLESSRARRNLHKVR